MTYDVIVLGVGGMGSAACHSLARRGMKVLGLEQYALGHGLGSSHGDTRLIRMAYFEEERYVPLVKRAYDLWDELSAATGKTLLHRSGLLIMGPESGGATLPKLLAAAGKHDVRVEILSARELGERYPQFRPGDGYRGVFEPGAGYLEVENCVLAMAGRARELGAEIRENERVLDWSATASEVTVRTGAATYRAAKLVVTAGPWAGACLRDVGLPLTVLRVPQMWFDAPAALEGAPAFAFDRPEGFLYGFPRRNGRIKMADYHPPTEEVADPASVDRSLRPADSAKVARCITECLPGVVPTPARASVCLYTMTPDENFVIDLHPRHENVAFAAGFSGHGFKFATVMGECLADLVATSSTALPIGFLRRRH